MKEAAETNNGQMEIFFNTIGLEGEDLKEKKRRAAGQYLSVLRFFRENQGRSFTPVEVRELAGMQRCSLNGIRRAITSLTEDKKLVKTEIKRPGEYDTLNHTWRLA